MRPPTPEEVSLFIENRHQNEVRLGYRMASTDKRLPKKRSRWYTLGWRMGHWVRLGDWEAAGLPFRYRD